MIRYYKIEQGNTNVTLTNISNSIKNTYKTDSIIVATDTNRIYYQSPKSAMQPILIGNTQKFISLDTNSSASNVLKPNSNYIQYGTSYTYNLPNALNYPQLNEGDKITLFIEGTPASDVILGSMTIPSSIAQKRQITVIYNNGNWIPLTASVIQPQLPSAQIQYNDTIGAGNWTDANDWAKWGITTLTSVMNIEDYTEVKKIISTSYAVPGSTVFRVASAIVQNEIVSTYFENNTAANRKLFKPYYLPSATLTGDWGITTIESGYAPADISGSIKPMAASAVYKFVTESTDPNSISGISLSTSVVTCDPATRIVDIEDLVEGNYTKIGISGSPYPMAASAVYEYVKNNVEDYTNNALSAVKLDGYKPAASNRVVDLGKNTLKVNGVILSADSTSAHQIDMSTGWVQITEGTLNHPGYYVQKTTDGYKLDPGIATLSSSYSSTSVNNNIMTVDGNAIPVMIKTNNNTLYPIEKGTISATTVNGVAKYNIDIRPYLIYDGSSSFGGSWTVYYGAGINDIYTTANTIQQVNIGNSDSTKAIYFGAGDVAIVTTSNSSPATITLQIPSYTAGTVETGLPVGHGMILKINNAGGKTIKFASRTIISSTGTYSVSVFNFGNGAEQVGEVTNVYAVNS